MKKKFFTLLTLLVAMVTGAWATIGDSFKLTCNGSFSQTTAGYFTITGSSFNSKFTGASYDGVNYTSGFKMESSSAITWTAEAEHTVTILQSDWESKTVAHGTPKSNQLDGVEIPVSDATSGTNYKLYTIEKVAAGTHTITRKGGENGIFMVKVVYTSESVTVVALPVITWNSSTNKATITCATDGATIYYTTDGSEPTSGSSVYSAEIPLTNSTTVRAIAIKSETSSSIAKLDCYVSHATADGYITSLGYNGGTVDGDVWTGTNFVLTNNATGNKINYVNLAGSQDGFKLNATDVYTLQPSEGIKVTKLVVVGKTWLAGNASTIAFDGFTPASGTFHAYGTETYVKTVEFTPSTEQTYGQTITVRPGANQLGAYIEVYGDVKTYTVTYDGNGATGGTAPTDATAHKHNSSVTVLGNTGSLEKTGGTFVGWNTEADGSGTAYAAGSTFTITGNTTLYAQWLAGDVETITYALATGTSATATISSSTATTDETNISSISIDQTNDGADGAGASDRTTKLAIKTGANGETFDSPTNYELFKFTIAAAKKFTPTDITIKVANVGSASANNIKYKATLSDNYGNSISNTYVVTTQDGTVETFHVTNSSKVGFAGNVTLKLWAWTINNKSNGGSAFRMGTPLTVSGVVADDEVPITTKTGRNYATCVPAKKLDFGNTDGITAYIATGLNGAEDAVVLKSVDVVDAGTPIIVKTDTKGATVNVPVTTASATDASENKLVAGDGVKAYNNEGNSYYYLASDQFHLANAGILQSGKAYLEVAGATAPQLSIVFGDSQTTGINAVNGEGLKVQGSEVYNLNGQRVLNPTKGLYIVNGRKVVVK